ncbi:hypothetical protein [Microcoleus sp. bin38.metabat.b11b12b14.051]|uniref:hypothetical protein n=1 Tax=Microcoleus sp. bin38.metabat.b11b12b14.051 TaxID=2742709 RepID=UPI0025FD78F2|nr:hypothetical protein [Microcoleus sp. bin38.metabat.b11b12b14.051]
MQTYARLDKETGFFPKSANHNQVLSKKPGFSAFVQTYARLDKETGFFPKSANHSIQGKNPVSGHPRVQD